MALHYTCSTELVSGLITFFQLIKNQSLSSAFRTRKSSWINKFKPSLRGEPNLGYLPKCSIQGRKQQTRCKNTVKPSVQLLKLLLAWDASQHKPVQIKAGLWAHCFLESCRVFRVESLKFYQAGKLVPDEIISACRRTARETLWKTFHQLSSDGTCLLWCRWEISSALERKEISDEKKRVLALSHWLSATHELGPLLHFFAIVFYTFGHSVLSARPFVNWLGVCVCACSSR